MKVVLRLIVAGFTFVLGVGAHAVAHLPLNLVFFLICFLGTPLIIFCIVLYQNTYLKKELRPAFGKGFLATFLWVFPSPLVAVLNLIAAFEDSSQLMLASSVVMSIINVVYGSVGLALCRWVNRYETEDHWLLNDYH